MTKSYNKSFADMGTALTAAVVPSLQVTHLIQTKRDTILDWQQTFSWLLTGLAEDPNLGST